jgi:hypothetical protein
MLKAIKDRHDEIKREAVSMELTAECKNFLDHLTEYLHGLLSSQKQYQIEEHLSNCDACREDLVMAYRMSKDEELTELEPAPEEESQSVWKKIKGKISSVLEWTKARGDELSQEPWFSLFEPEPLSCTRSSDSHFTVDYIHSARDISEGLQAEMYLTKSDRNRARMKVRVLKNGQKAKYIRLTLKQGNGREQSCPLREEYVVFDDLSLDSYHLSVSESGQNKWDYSFKLTETGVDENG